MNKEILNSAYVEINNFRNKLGETFFDAVMEDDNTTYEMAKSIIATFSNCNSKKEFEAANSMLIAVCGYSFETLIGRIKERDEQGYAWESCS